MKKPLNQFIEEIIIPIEKKKVDDGKFYKSLEAKPTFPELDSNFKYSGSITTDVEESALIYWGIENQNFPGKWEEREWNEFRGGSVSLQLPLYTLSTLLFCNILHYSLFVAEYEGTVRPIRIGQLFAPFASGEDAKVPDYLEHIFNCLPRSVNTSKARIVQRINRWDYIRCWEFALMCTERGLKIGKENAEIEGYNIPDVFFEALDFAKAHYKARCFQQEGEYNRIQTKYADKITGNFWVKYAAAENGFTDEMNKWTKENYHLPYLFLKDAILECMNFYTRRPNLFGNIRALIGWFNKDKYRNEYKFPSYIDQTYEFHRIEQAFSKGELDWQVENLIKFIES